MTSCAWFPCYPKDLIAKTTKLRAHDFGAYWRLLCEYYQTGPLSNDDETLRLITGVDRPEWPETRSKVMAFFTMNGDGHWHQVKADLIIADRDQMIANRKAQTLKARQANPKHRFVTNAVTTSHVVTNPVTNEKAKESSVTNLDTTVQVQPQPQVQPQKQSFMAPVDKVLANTELQRVEERIATLKNQGTLVAGDTLRYTIEQAAMMKKLRERKAELVKLLGFVA